MDIVLSTSQERRLLFIESLLNATDKISKVAPNSVNSGIAIGASKIAGKAEKDITLAISELFPDLAYDTLLDRAAKNLGFTSRLGAYASTTYERVTAAPGTTYTPGTHRFVSKSGISFAVQREVVVGPSGYAYIPIVAEATGERSNVEALSISQVTPTPAGHLNCINEVAASFGTDIETDEMFRARIKDGGNQMARGTLAMLQAIAIAINPKVLKAYNYGITKLGKRKIALATQNGEELSDIELTALRTQISPFLTLSDSQWWGTNYSGIQFVNVQYQPIDISFRVVLDDTANADDVRKSIQIAISKYFDFRTFDPIAMKVEWDNLLQIVKETPGIKYVPDQFFYPHTDVVVNTYKLPRLRGFLMLDIKGVVISNQTGTLSPVYYPNEADFSYSSTVLQTL